MYANFVSAPLKSDLLATHHHIPIGDVEHSWGALRSSLNITAQLKQPPRPQKPWISEATLHLANSKSKLWQASLANPTPQAKAEYKVASRAAHKSALADYHQHFKQLLTKVQHSMRKGDTHPAYKVLRQLSKPKFSTKKTKVLVVGRNAAAQAAESIITLRGDQLEVVSQFKYLGSVFTSDCTLDAEMTHRVTAANSAFQQLRRLDFQLTSSDPIRLLLQLDFQLTSRGSCHDHKWCHYYW
ncbi:MAG: hypothetical protein FRX49_11920 [Trebouxia sp. A1-2]|nr:MAG: hypothetical protein FRX49_11920 [Trebouxia sp. A1-2]